MLLYDDLLQLFKPLYEVIDSDDYYHITMTNHLKNNLKIVPFPGDLACFIRHYLGNYTLWSGFLLGNCLKWETEVIELSELAEKRFKPRLHNYDALKFAHMSTSIKRKSYPFVLTLRASRLN